jgi:phosphoribosylformimino-5-aminoimidazole carboxamide ribotide isomerase
MILFPAIDLKEGRCVRLAQGDMSRATVFNNDPGEQARVFEAKGFEYLHIVDLDGAFAGQARNSEAVEIILSSIQIPAQLGGGIRDMNAVAYWLDRGVTRVILGTAAVKNPGFVREAARHYPGRVAVGIDAREGMVAVEGWAKTTAMSALDLGKSFEDAGVAAIIYTDIVRDGLLQGLNLEATLALADKVAIPVIASGGLASLKDVERLLAPDYAKIAGAVAGRALYDGRLDAESALAMIRAARAAKGAGA